MVTKTEFVPRVNQLDALQLDDDILRIVQAQLVKALENLSPGILSRYSPELDLLVRSTLWTYSVGLKSASFGQKLLFMSYDRDDLHKGYKLQLHFIFNVLLKYLRDNVSFRMTHMERAQEIVNWSENLASILRVLIWFRFLRTGQRPSLTSYVLGLDNISYDGGRRREIGYNYITRELIWGGFMELLTFSLPFINYHSIKRKICDIIYPLAHRNANEWCRPSVTLQSNCTYCNERPTLPYYMGCSHIFCYYCLKGNKTADANFKCPACNWQSCQLLPV